MRPQEINRSINLAFKRFLRDKRLIHFHKCKKQLIRRLEWYRKTDPELTAEEAYYLDCIPNRNVVMGRLEYISDRWNCPGRIKFILEVLKQGY